jgi:hypothetical protein
MALSDKTFEERLDELAHLPGIVNDLVLDASTEAQTVDALGTIRSVETGLAEVRKMGASEVVDGTRGERFAFEQGMTSTKTYNTQSLVAKFMRAWNLDPLQTFLRLIDMDVVRLSWQYTKLMKAVQANGISLTTTNNEIEEGDPNIDIGKLWKHGYPKYVAVTPDDEG